jgi:hypothetical protein
VLQIDSTRLFEICFNSGRLNPYNNAEECGLRVFNYLETIPSGRPTIVDAFICSTLTNEYLMFYKANLFDLIGFVSVFSVSYANLNPRLHSCNIQHMLFIKHLAKIINCGIMATFAYDKETHIRS